MRIFATALMFALTLGAGAASAQGPAPQTILSSTLTRAQEVELNNRLARLQQRFDVLARETDLRAGAVRNVAIEIFGADPNLDFETYVTLIENGARELRTFLTDAHARTDPDPIAAALRVRAIEAAEDGRLTEARALYDQLIVTNRSARQRARDAEDLADAADMAEAARLAFAAADYLDAARRYGEAAELAPEGVRERWEYTVWRAEALTERSRLFAEPAPLAQAVAAYQSALTLRLNARDWAATQNDLGIALQLQGERGAPGALERALAAYDAALSVMTLEADPAGWAVAQMNLGNTLSVLGERGAPGALERAVAAYEAALSVRTLEADPAGWAGTQMNLGSALLRQGERGAPDALARAVAAYEAALSVTTREADPAGWAQMQMNLGTALRLQGERGAPGALGRAVAAFEAALSVMTREADPVGWAQTQVNLGGALRVQGERGAPGAIERAVAAYEAGLSVLTREADLAGWALTTYSLAIAYRAMGRFGAARATAEGALAVYEQLGDRHWANEARGFIARLPAD